MHKFPWTQYVSTLLFYLLIAAVIFLIANVFPRKQAQPITAEQARAAQQQQQVEQTKQIYQQVLSAVGKLMVLPNSLPQISVVQDPGAFIKQNPIFAGTSAGDIVLIYTDRVIIYSPKFNRIVHSESITPAQQPASVGINSGVSASALPTETSSTTGGTSQN